MDTHKITVNDEYLEIMKKMQEIVSATSFVIKPKQVRDSIMKMPKRISLLAKTNWVQNMNLINQSLQNSLKNFSHTVAQFQSTYDMKIIQRAISEMAKTLSNMQTEQLKNLSQINFRKLNFDFQNKKVKDLAGLFYESKVNNTSNVAISKEGLKETFIKLQKINGTLKRFNIQLHDGVEKFKREYFILYIIIKFLFSFLSFCLPKIISFVAVFIIN